MPSLKLRNPFRRNPDHPTLRQRLVGWPSGPKADLSRGRLDALLDAELLAVGRRLDAAHAAWLETVEAAQEPWSRRDQFYEERGRSTLRVIEEANALPGVDEANNAEGAAFEALTRICTDVWRLPAHTAAGVAVKARAAMIDVWPTGGYESSAADGADEDLPDRSIRLLIEACCSLAGVDWRGQPLTFPEA